MRTSEASREDALLVYSELRTAGKPASGKAVWTALKQRYRGRNVRSLRAVQGDIKSLSEPGKFGFLPFDKEEWKTWEAGVVPAAHYPGVLLIDSVSRELAGRPLDRHEAFWGGRILGGLNGLDPVVQWFLTYHYGVLEQVRAVLGRQKSVTYPLDQLLAFQPWKPERRTAWNHWLLNTAPEGEHLLRNLASLARTTLPEAANESIALWARTQLIGPWDERTDEWAWERLLERRYGNTEDKE